MKQIAISKFKAKCVELLEEVGRTRRPLRVTRRGKPLADRVPPSRVTDRKAMIGSMKGSIKILGDIISQRAIQTIGRRFAIEELKST